MSEPREGRSSAAHSETPPIKLNDHRHAQSGHAEELVRLTAELEAAHKRVNELASALQAGERDREDYKRRHDRERERMIDVEKGQIAQTLLEAVDELDRCLASAGDSPLAQGVRLIRDAMLKRAEGLGLERVALLHRPFDPNLAEATDVELTANPDEDGRVTAEVRACYQLKGRVVRPGSVRVARFQQPLQA